MSATHTYVQPQPATQSPFLRAEASVASIEAGGELVHTSPARAVLVNRFGKPENVGVLYKDVSYLADPFMCSEGPAACGDEGSAAIFSSKVVPLLHTKRTTARKLW